MLSTTIISAFLMAAPAPANAPAAIHVAWVKRLTSKTAALALREADGRLMARCFDPEGLDPTDVDAASLSLVGTQVQLFQGPRRISQGKVLSIGISADPLLPCAVEVTARFDRPLPLTAKGDVLWATNQPHDSSPREPVRQEVAETARGALPQDMRDLCLEQRTVSRRGVKSGTYVGFTCADGSQVRSALVFVPRPTAEGAGQPRLALIEDGSYGSLSLVEVLNPKAAEGYRLVLRREWNRPPLELDRLELWEDGREGAKAAASEALAGDMLFLMDENLRALEMEGFSDEGGDGRDAQGQSVAPGSLEGMPLQLE